MYYVESVEDIVVELATQLHAATHLHAINTTWFFFLLTSPQSRQEQA